MTKTDDIDDLRLEAPYDPQSLADLVRRLGSPLMLVDCDIVRRQYRTLAAALPGVRLHYALKPLPERTVIDAVAAEGGHFDVATTGEIELLRQAGISPERCIHTHPIKRDEDIRAALDFGIRTFVADNEEEVAKFAAYADRAELLLRVSYRSPAAVVDLSRKFGCDPDAVPALARIAQDLGIRVVGLSFHVGSQSRSPATKLKAIANCASILKKGKAPGMAKPAVIDIGGGFPIDYLEPAMPVEAFCAPIRAALQALPPDTRIIAEPGRFICGPAGTVLTTVMGRAWRGGRWWYYLDDGLYGSFSGQLYDHARYPVEPLMPRDEEHEPCVLAGPTCDSIDVIAEDFAMPPLQIGDILIGRQMGAYTVASATDFNFFRRARTVIINR